MSRSINCVYQMRSTPFNPGSWLLLIVFSIQAILPGVTGGLQLCIGCDGSGFAFESMIAPSATSSADACCSGTSQSTNDTNQTNDSVEYRDDQRQDQSINCRCIKVSIDSSAFLPSRNSTQQPAETSPLQVAMFDHLLPQAPIARGLSPRAPPKANPSWLACTLLSQRTSLLV